MQVMRKKKKAELKTDIKTLSLITVIGKGLEESWGEQFITNVISPDDKVQAGQTLVTLSKKEPRGPERGIKKLKIESDKLRQRSTIARR
jgi:hypothetical protein